MATPAYLQSPMQFTWINYSTPIVGSGRIKDQLTC